jgi:deoxyribodipyrimidine photo-lyase
MSNKFTVNIVWFKRDLRIIDHKPLAEAALAKGHVLPIYIVEDDYWQLPDTSKRHWLFTHACLIELDTELRKLGQGLVVLRGEATHVLNTLAKQFTISGLYSHEEVGNDWVYQRDIKVAAWCKDSHITWYEYPQFGVVRHAKSLDDWSSHVTDMMSHPMVAAPKKLSKVMDKSLILPDWRELNLMHDGLQELQTPGRKQAQMYLNSFLELRGEQYQREMASPVSSEWSCSRLSPYLAYGCLSIREVTQAVSRRVDNLKQQPFEKRRTWLSSLESFSTRLRWHCYFMQKLEMEPHVERENLLKEADNLREYNFNRYYFSAWQRGVTGYPFVDACMRTLIKTGWANFRMRAMLISFSSYQLWQHWAKPAHYLATLFTDYEPSIHYNQIQIQSGTTKTNLPKIYNPIKQSREQDQQGDFIRKWVPELTNVPSELIHEPWLMSNTLQKKYNCEIGRHYPPPIVDNKATMQSAKQKIFAIAKTSAVRNKMKHSLERTCNRQDRSQNHS